jgi:hypothetical protein
VLGRLADVVLKRYDRGSTRRQVMRFGLAIAAVAAALCTLPGCVDTKCEKENTGKISMENTSGDVFIVVIDGTGGGKVYPWDKEKFIVDVGEHLVEMKREDGSDVCSSITVHVDECETEGLCCPTCSSNGEGCPDGYPVDCGDYCCIDGAWCCAEGCCTM